MNARINDVLDGLTVAIKKINANAVLWASEKTPFVDWRVVAPENMDAVERPAVLLRARQLGGLQAVATGEMCRGDLIVDAFLLAGDGGLGEAAMRSLYALAEDVFYAVAADFQLADGNPDERVLAFHASATDFEIDTEASDHYGIAIGLVTINVNLDFPAREG